MCDCVGNFTQLNMCTGYSVIFTWNTGTPSQVFGLNQIGSDSCPNTFAGTRLLVTSASSPSPSNTYAYNLYQPGPVRLHQHACTGVDRELCS